MRKLLAGALACCALCAPAAAQSARDFAGTWAFRTDYYGQASLSGAAIVTPAGRGEFAIALVAQEQSVEGGAITVAAQTCRGLATGAQLSIMCALDEAMENYLPDNFELTLTDEGRMEGVLQSAAQAQALFVRLR